MQRRLIAAVGTGGGTGGGGTVGASESSSEDESPWRSLCLEASIAASRLEMLSSSSSLSSAAVLPVVAAVLFLLEISLSGSVRWDFLAVRRVLTILFQQVDQTL